MPIEIGNYTGRNIIADGDPPRSVAVTIKPGVQYLAGQLLARKTSDGLYEAHDNDGSGGLEVCSGVLALNVDTTTPNGGQISAPMYTDSGHLIASKLVYKDADALTAALSDLKARILPGRDILIF